ncbi:unnamed protein product [Adineta steineri]|uniref:Uncharacterized protein n=1 Tax=Adineta steineri TaxID=433720 RepID=A0A813NFC2_9BILA|nr:unnamed protein product [Adineta steineri]CAF0748471.1 unnamed protein product [Adineta steineri]
MVKNSHLTLLVMVVTFIFLLLLPIVNCTNKQMKKTSIKQNNEPAAIDNVILQQEDLNNYYNGEEGNMIDFMDDILKSYPQRRASSFHAMRGKRFLKTA